MKIYFLDHYDSFSYNVINWLKSSTCFNLDIIHIPYDNYNMISKCLEYPYPLVISPGPKSPLDIPLTINLIKNFLGKVPILGICLGHQALCYSQGANIIPSKYAWHGTQKIVKILNKNLLFNNMLNKIKVGTYNSLVVSRNFLPTNIKILAQDLNRQIEAVKIITHSKWDAYGIQFHPDSFLTLCSDQIAINWLNYICNWYK